MAEKAADSEFENLEALEKTFQKVLMEVMADKSLDAFRAEYERLHDALIHCHKCNTELINRVKAMNEEIITNSSKVKSVLKLSHDDQKTIAKLRFEIDKSWRMVEIAQDREEKTKYIIEDLKVEAAKLQKLIETEGPTVFGPQPTSDELKCDVQELHREMQMYVDQIGVLTRDIADGKTKREQDLARIESLKREHESMSGDLVEQGNVRGAVDNECMEMMKEVMELKQRAQDAQNEIEENEHRKRCEKEKIKDLEWRIGIEQKTLKEAEDAKLGQQGRMRLTAKRLEDAKKQRERSHKAVMETSANIEEITKQIGELEKELAAVTSEGEEIQGVLDAMVKQREAVGAEMEQARKQVMELRNQMGDLSRDMVRSEADVAATTAAVDNLQKKKAKTRKSVLDERKKTKMVRDQGGDVLNDILGTKRVAHKQRQTIAQLTQESNRYQRQMGEGRSNEFAMRADKKFKDKENSNLTKSLQATQKQIGKQKLMTDIAMQQRDMVVNEIKDVQVEGSQVEEQNRALATEIKDLKERMRDKDQECIEIHLQRQNLKKVIKQLRSDVASWQEKLLKAQDEQSTLENKVVKSRYVSDVAARDVQSLRRDNTQLESGIRTLELTMHKKIDECSALRKKSAVLCSTISGGERTYNLKTKQIQDLFGELQMELAKQEKMKVETHHSQMLKQECIRLERQTVVAQARTRAMEEELDKPRYVHRWKFLESTAPDVFQMIQMTNSLRNQYMVKAATLQRVQEILQRTQQDADRAIRLVGTITSEERDEAVKFYTKALQRKARQMEQISSRISGQQNYVSDSKQNVEMLKTQIRDIKGQYYVDKKASEDLRSRSQVVRRSEDKKAVLNATRFVGGGFALPGSSTLRSSLSEAPKPLAGTLVTPSVVVPKVARNGKRSKLLGGWNAKRKPLNQYVKPTVDVKD